MRDIKFRSWGPSCKHMWQWEELKGTAAVLLFGEPKKERGVSIPMQYTGIKDKNGKEIYEGDVLTNGDSYIKYVVEFIDSGFKARQTGNQSSIGLMYHQDFLEIIGNIYENPELLEVIK